MRVEELTPKEKVLRKESPLGKIVIKLPNVVVASLFAESLTIYEKLMIQSVAIEVANVPKL